MELMFKWEQSFYGVDTEKNSGNGGHCTIL
jgi:hypothetical protein